MFAKDTSVRSHYRVVIGDLQNSPVSRKILLTNPSDLIESVSSLDELVKSIRVQEVKIQRFE